MVRNIFIKPYIDDNKNKKHIFLKKLTNFNIFIMYNPHMIYNDCDNLYGFFLLLNRNNTIPYTLYIKNDDNIIDYINKTYKLDLIRDIHKIVSTINNTKYNIYYINCISKYYNFILEKIKTDLIWKDFYFIKDCKLDIIEYKINDFTINDYEILNKLKEIKGIIL